jgi:hypothetical protein
VSPAIYAAARRPAALCSTDGVAPPTAATTAQRASPTTRLQSSLDKTEGNVSRRTAWTMKISKFSRSRQAEDRNGESAKSAARLGFPRRPSDLSLDRAMLHGAGEPARCTGKPLQPAEEYRRSACALRLPDQNRILALVDHVKSPFSQRRVPEFVQGAETPSDVLEVRERKAFGGKRKDIIFSAIPKTIDLDKAPIRPDCAKHIVVVKATGWRYRSRCR